MAQGAGGVKKTAAKKVARTAARKAAPAKKTSANKTAAKKTSAKKTGAKKTAAKKTGAKKTGAKKTAAKKTGAKKTGAKKTGAKKVARAAGPAPVEGLEALVYRLITAAAERGLSAVYGAQGDAALAAIDLANFAPPPSYRRFMASFGSLRVLDEDGEVAGLCVYTPAEVARTTRDLVRVPAGVTWEDAQGRACTITTDHLIAFAAGPSGCVWCFDASAPAGELPVVCHDQDEPLHARSVETGAPVSGRAPEHPDFMAWLVGQVEAFCAPPRRRRH